MYYFNKDDGMEIGPFLANCRQDAIKVVHRALKRDLGPASYVKSLIQEFKQHPEWLTELTPTEIDNIKRNYSSLK